MGSATSISCTCGIVSNPGYVQGWIQDFPKGGGGGGGGPNGYACCMAVAVGRVPLKRLPCVLNVCGHIYIFVAFALFHSHQIFAKVCMQGGSNLDVL